jgi:DNA-binding beta-propeller fold protein YncE
MNVNFHDRPLMVLVSPNRKVPRVVCTLVLSCLLLLPVAGAGPITAVAAATPAAAGNGFVALGGPAGALALDARTGTVYVPVQCAESGCPPNAPGRAVDVISMATCNASDRSGCRVVATAPADDPLAAAVDETTDTLYLANGPGTITVVDGAHCNAELTSGCGKDLATVKLSGPLNPAAYDAVVDPLTSTLYVAGPKAVAVVDLAQCNALSTRGCGHAATWAKDPDGPVALDVDLSSDTVYVANTGVGNNAGNGDTVSVIDGATCNGSDHGGCGLTPRTVTVGSGATWVSVNQANGTVYVANTNDGTVSVIDGARCDAIVTSGCAATPPAVFTGENPASMGFDQAAHTLITLNADDDTLSELSTTSCSGAESAGCPKVVPNVQASLQVGPGFEPFPNTVVVNNSTAYLVNVGGGGDNVLSVVSVARCNALNTSGCRPEAASAPDPEYWGTVDPATGTLYAGNEDKGQIDVINAATCDQIHIAGCAPVARIPMKDPAAALGAIDDSTHTLYASDPTTGTVSVINTATCDAARTSGCTSPHPVIRVGPLAGSPVLNAGTGTLYVPYGALLNKVAVVDITACSAELTSGCDLPHGTVVVGQQTNELGLSYATDTVYATSTDAKVSLPATYGDVSGGTAGDALSVINGSTCNGKDFSGCAHPAATVRVGTFPYGIAVDDALHTVYVVDNRNGDLPGELTMINSSTCNGFNTAGCHKNFPTVYVGDSPRLAVLDANTGLVYITDRSDAAVSVLRAARCNALVTTGCPPIAPEQAVGSKPVGLAVDQVTGTAYVMNTVSGTMSVLNAR